MKHTENGGAMEMNNSNCRNKDKLHCTENEYCSITGDAIYHEVGEEDTDETNNTHRGLSCKSVEENNYDTLERPKDKFKTKELNLWKFGTILLLFISLASISGVIYLSVKISNNCDDDNNICKKMETGSDRAGTESDDISVNLKQEWFHGEVKPCRDGWIFSDSSLACYYVSSTMKSWMEARDVCSNNSACLTNVLSVSEAKWIGNLTNSDTWIGGKQHYYQYEWICDIYDYSRNISDNSFWAENEPKPNDNEVQCLQLWKILGFLLDDHKCTIEKRFVCKSFPEFRLLRN